MNCDSASVTSPSAKTPIVCVTVTIAPRVAASRGVPRRPIRYAVTIVLPWPGESACAAPQKSAAASEAMTTSTLGWAREQALRVRAELVRGTRRLRADDDLLPADPAGVVRIAHDQVCRCIDARPAKDQLEPQRVEAADAA